MDLTSLLTCHPRVRLATPRDNARLLDFYESMGISDGKLVLSYRRQPDFFRLLEAQGDSSLVFYLEDDAGRIDGIASISYRKGLVDGKHVRVGYLGDLRVARNQGAVRAWRNFYGSFLDASPNLSESGYCSHYLTAILDENKPARAGLIKNRHGSFQYAPILPYSIAMLVGRIPIVRKSHQSLRIRAANASDSSHLITFLDNCNRNKPYGFIFSDGEWLRRQNTWEDFGIDSFLVAEDDRYGIVGCLALWRHPTTKRMIIEKMPFAIRILTAIYSIFGNTPLTDSERGIDLVHVTHFEAANHLPKTRQSEIRAMLLDQAWTSMKSADRGAIMSFRDDAQGTLCRMLGLAYLTHRTPATLYRVHSTTRDFPTLNPMSDGSDFDPGFEMALV